MNEHQPAGVLKTVARVVHTGLIRYSTGSYEIHSVLDIMDYAGDISEISTLNFAKNMVEACEILLPLRPGSTHYVEGGICLDGGICLMLPYYYPYCGDMDAICSLYSEYDKSKNSRILLPETTKSVSGCIHDFIIEKTDTGDAAIVQLKERDDYLLIILPDLFERYKSSILGGTYLDYYGISQYCSIKLKSEESFSMAIIVKSIEMPILPDEVEY